jgi:hypothetical protein
MPHGPANFCLMVVKPYYTEEAPNDNQHHDDQPHDDQPHDDQSHDDTAPTTGNEKVQHHG